MSHTTSYATLEVNPATFDDIKERLRTAGVLSDYLDRQDGREILVLGTVALVTDPLKVVEESLNSGDLLQAMGAGNPAKITRMSVSTRARSAPKWKNGDRKLIRKKLHVYRQQHADGGWLVDSRGRPRMEWVAVDGLIPPDGQEKDWVRVDGIAQIVALEREHNCYQDFTCDGHYLIRRGDPEQRRIAAWHRFGRIGYIHKDFAP